MHIYIMPKKLVIEVNLRNIILFIVIILVVYKAITMYNKIRMQAIHVPKHVLHNVLKEGRYEGTAEYGKTDLYPKGLTAKVTASIEHVRDGDVLVKNTIDAYDKQTGKHAYYASREITYDYKAIKNRFIEINKSIIEYFYHPDRIDTWILKNDNITNSNEDYLEYVEIFNITF